MRKEPCEERVDLRLEVLSGRIYIHLLDSSTIGNHDLEQLCLDLQQLTLRGAHLRTGVRYHPVPTRDGLMASRFIRVFHRLPAATAWFRLRLSG